MSDQLARTVRLSTRFYQQFDADLTAAHPGSGYGGWQTQELPLSLDHSAVAVMHAWDSGTPEAYPGWFRACEYLSRSYPIADEVLPPLLSTVRASAVRLVHVAAGDYAAKYPGYRPPEPRRSASARADAVYEELKAFRSAHVFPGAHNQADIARGVKAMDFYPTAAPHDDEPVVVDSAGLDRWCQDEDVNHLIYVGFTINGCIVSSPGGMLDMFHRGYLCSTIAEAVTAIENKETVAGEAGKAQALWQVALLFGFVYSQPDFVNAISATA